ncbi:MAG: choice-of-anchor R domain-containing protein [Pirellulales bacterium]
MLTKFSLFCLCGLVVLGLCPTFVRAEVIYSNLGPNGEFQQGSLLSVRGPDSLDGRFDLAVRFSPGASYRLTQIDVAAVPFEPPATNAPRLELRNEVDGLPGPVVLVANTFLDVLPVPGDLLSWLPNSEVQLTQGANYWLVMSAALPDSETGWSLNSTGALGVAGTDGTAWFTADTVDTPAFRVFGELVPEPVWGPIWLGATWLFSGAGWRRRRGILGR